MHGPFFFLHARKKRFAENAAHYKLELFSINMNKTCVSTLIFRFRSRGDVPFKDNGAWLHTRRQTALTVA